MKKLSLALVCIMLVSMLAACGGGGQSSAPAPAPASPAAPAPAPAPGEAPAESDKPVEITVVTSYGGDDGNRQHYEAAYKAYEEATGNKVRDGSGTSNEEWKARINADFETGAEPDVLLYFNGVDSNRIVESGKVVSIDEIRAVYPDYAANMKDDMMGASPVDGKNYSVPVNGYWEGLFVNKNVLADCGIDVPGPDYTWEQFLEDCQTIKDKGYTPIAASLHEVPHYWFEFTILNNGSLATHLNIPDSSEDPTAQAWLAGFEDIKELYDRGFFPANTLTAPDPETFQMMAEDKAAFAIDGSWKVGWFQDNVADINDYTVTYVPGKGDRKASDIIGGLSSGYYITRKAWEDPEKQKACVDFVMSMTTDEVVTTFGFMAVTALKNGTTPPAEIDALQQAALDMTKGATGITGATQDGMIPAARDALFANIKNIVISSKTGAEALDEALAIHKEG